MSIYQLRGCTFTKRGSSAAARVAWHALSLVIRHPDYFWYALVDTSTRPHTPGGNSGRSTVRTAPVLLPVFNQNFWLYVI